MALLQHALKIYFDGSLMFTQRRYLSSPENKSKFILLSAEQPSDKLIKGNYFFVRMIREREMYTKYIIKKERNNTRREVLT